MRPRSPANGGDNSHGMRANIAAEGRIAYYGSQSLGKKSP
jgi:hypothetical protein